jgi:hypothetical protein
MKVVKRRDTKSFGVVHTGEGGPESGVRNRTLRADPPPPSGRTKTLPQIYAAEESGETAMSEVVRQLALLSDPLSVPILTHPIGPEDGLEPQEAYLASLLGTNMTVQMIVDVSPLSEDETVRVLARFVTNGFVKLASIRSHRK